MINIIFFAKYREQIGISCLRWPSAGLQDVGDVVAELRRLYKDKTSFFDEQNVLIAVNQELATIKTAIKTGDEVAFFPPVTGG
jgi:molybdopterin synthase sulfur carrier subunit